MKVDGGKLHQALERILEEEGWGVIRAIGDTIIEEKNVVADSLFRGGWTYHSVNACRLR